MPRILHISDIHFGPHHRPEIAAAVVDEVAGRRPDAVLISGDVTHRAKPRQFREARAFVEALEAPTLAVPGNHDVPLYRFWERFLAPYGAYRKHFAADIEPVLEVDGVFAVGVCTAHGLTLTDGRIRMKRLARLAEQLARAPKDACRVVVVHHPVAPPPLLEVPRAIDNAREASELFAAAGVELVLAGHIHQTYVTTLGSFFERREATVRMVHTGTTTTSRGRWEEKGRNSLNWIEIGRDFLEVTPHLWSRREEAFRPAAVHRFPRGAAQLETVATPTPPAAEVAEGGSTG